MSDSRDTLYYAWRQLKHALQVDGLMSPQDLHIVIGAAVFFAAYFIVRRTKSRRVSTALAVSSLLILQGINEGLDIGFGITRSHGEADIMSLIGDSAQDTVYTILIPSGLLLFALIKAAIRE